MMESFPQPWNLVEGERALKKNQMNFMQYWTSKTIKSTTDKNLALKHFYANRTIFCFN